MTPPVFQIARLWFCIAVLIASIGPSVESPAQDFQFNGSAVNNGGIQLTDGKPFEAGSAFWTTRQPVHGFAVNFNFQLADANADGFAFVIQGNGPDALGSLGGGIGYGNPPRGQGASIPNSVAIVFDLHNNQGEGSNSVRLETGGDSTAVCVDESGHLYLGGPWRSRRPSLVSRRRHSA